MLSMSTQNERLNPPLIESSLIEAAHGLFQEYEEKAPLADVMLIQQILPQDILQFEDELLSFEEAVEPKITTVEELLNYYTQAPDAGMPATKEGFKAPQKVQHPHYALHLAARDGDVKKIQQLYQSGANINLKDVHQSTPLHVAALFDQKKAIHQLIQYGAQIDQIGYMGFTPLQMAIYKENYGIARQLVEGGAKPQLKNKGNIDALTMLITQLVEKIEKGDQCNQNNSSKISDIIKTLEVCASHCGKYCHFSVPHPHNETEIAVPISLQLKLIAAQMPEPELRNEILTLSDRIAQFDPSEDIFIHAKNFLHVFPTDNIYELKLDPSKKILISAEGNYPLVTTALAKKSLLMFADHLESTAADPLKITVFKSLAEVYEQAAYFVAHVKDKQMPVEAFTLYQEGKTVLLPSGWNGHFVDIILSNPQQLYIVGNSGNRFTKDPAGAIFHHLQEPDKITPEFIQEVLTNTNQLNLEYENMYKYEIMEKIGYIKFPEQKYGNCAWESHRNAIKALINIELLNNEISPIKIKSLTTEFFQMWDEFHAHYQIKQYMSNHPALEAAALVDVLAMLYEKEVIEGDRAARKQAKKIMEALVSPHYHTEFNNWLHKNTTHFNDKFDIKLQAIKDFAPKHGAAKEAFSKLVDFDFIQGKLASKTIEPFQLSENQSLKASDPSWAAKEMEQPSKQGYNEAAYEATSHLNISPIVETMPVFFET